MKDINVYAFSDEASPYIDGQIKALLRNDLKGMEIRFVDGVSIADISAAKAREVRKRMDDSGLSVFSVGSPLGKIGIRDHFLPHLDKFKHTLELAHILGATRMRIFSFYTEGNADSYTDEVLLRLERFLEAAKGSGVLLCHENEKGIFGDVPERCALIHKSLPEIRAVFDPANFVQCGVDTLHSYALLKPYVAYMHIKDALADGSVVPSGYGIGNLPAIARDMMRSGVTDFTVEPHLTVFPGLSALEREEERSRTGHISYPDANTAFRAAVEAFRNIIERGVRA